MYGYVCCTCRSDKKEHFRAPCEQWELSATAIYVQFPLSPQAVSQHLKVLREAHLVEMEKRAQKHVYRLNPQTLSQFEAWVSHMKQRWSESFEVLDAVLEIEKKKLEGTNKKEGK